MAYKWTGRHKQGRKRVEVGLPQELKQWLIAEVKRRKYPGNPVCMNDIIIEALEAYRDARS